MSEARTGVDTCAMGSGSGSASAMGYGLADGVGKKGGGITGWDGSHHWDDV